MSTRDCRSSLENFIVLSSFCCLSEKRASCAAETPRKPPAKAIFVWKGGGRRLRAREKRERGAPAMIFSLAFPFSKKNEKKRRRRCSLNTKTSAAIQQRVCALVRAVQPRFPKPATSETWTLSTAWLPLRQKRGECSFERELLLDWLMKNSSASGQCWRRCALTSLLNLFSFSFLLPRANNTTTPPTTNAASPASPSSSRQTRPAGSRCLQR